MGKKENAQNEQNEQNDQKETANTGIKRTDYFNRISDEIGDG